MKLTVFIIVFFTVVALAYGKSSERKGKGGRANGAAGAAGAAQPTAGQAGAAGSGWANMAGQSPFAGGWQFGSFPGMSRPGAGNSNPFGGFWG
ncbi:UNVERIFIED_CONTAM: hypothetical protein PYX00_006491 [Menopon gallinae]|uniref:Uncharacterized protein n=1 Tax=Menopon gallinae TaxID=328185 RepID=A0AAW2HW21_9NEOP